MKTIIQFSILFLLITFKLSAQKTVLEGLNFDEGNWEIYGLAETYTPAHDFKTEMQDFYIKDVQFLKSLQKAWVLAELPQKGLPYYDYNIYVKQNGVTKLTLGINLGTNRLCIYDDNYALTPEKRDLLKKLTTPLPRHELIIPTAQQARHLLDKTSTMTGILVKSGGNWEQFDGKLVFHAPVKNRFKYDEVEALLKKKFPETAFNLLASWGWEDDEGQSWRAFDFSCNKNTAETFDAYPIETAWTPYTDIEITIYGLSKAEIEKLKQP